MNMSDSENDPKKSPGVDSVSSFIQGKKTKQVPFIINPFADDTSPERASTLQVNVADIKWSDLLLELAMTTTFASLTDGTPILEKQAVVSYLCFFAMVWWVWASQATYNLAFRQADWLHRLFVFLQLIIFCSLAAFTNHFNITTGIAKDEGSDTIAALQLGLGLAASDIDAATFRRKRLVRLNSKGISVVMALSRLLLFGQYLIVLVHALKSRKDANKIALYSRLSSLLFSILCYLIAAYVVIGNVAELSKGRQIAKLVLWFSPLILEVAAHFVRGKFVSFQEGVFERSSTIFTIILGGGLDKITNGFQFIVGSPLGTVGAGVIFSAAVIFISEFTLYFSSTKNLKISNRRALAWFYSHFFYLSALIITLQAIGALLTFGELDNAIDKAFQPFNTLVDAVDQNSTSQIVLSNYQKADELYKKFGLSFFNIVDQTSAAIRKGIDRNDSTIPASTVLQLAVRTYLTILRNFEAEPERSSLLFAQINAFINADPSNSTAVNRAAYFAIIDGMLKARGTPATWFYGTAGATFVTLVLLTWIVWRPRDKFDWILLSVRLGVGASVICMSALSIGSSKPVIDSNGKFSNSKIWLLVYLYLVLPIFAIIIGTEQLFELWLSRFAVHRAPVTVDIDPEGHKEQ